MGMTGAAAQDGPVSPAQAWRTIVILSAIYVLAIVDRQILAILLPGVKAELGLSDTHASLLIGPAFALLYATASVPIARIAETWSRKGTLTIGVAVWGACTVACGLAGSFWGMFAARIGVGVGEAALTPSAYSLVTDLAPKKTQGRAMSVFVVGGALGGGASLLIGGVGLQLATAAQAHLPPALAGLAPWRLVLIGVGLVTILSTAACFALVEPRRDRQDGGPPASFLSVCADVWRRRSSYAFPFVAGPLQNMAMFAISAWLPTVFIRLRDWSPVEAGWKMGAAVALGAGLGALLGGAVGDALARRRVAGGAVLVTVVGTALAIPLLWSAIYAPDDGIALAAAAAVYAALGAFNPLVPLYMQQVTPPETRTQTAALFLLTVNLIGIGLGATLTAMVADHLAADGTQIGLGLALVGTAALAVSAVVALACLPLMRRQSAP